MIRTPASQGGWTRSDVNLYLALVHYPVLDKNGSTIASAITPIDLHDLARVAKTYAVRGVYVVTPLEDQRQIAGRLIEHWTGQFGTAYNPKRKEALELIAMADSVVSARADIVSRAGAEARVITTSARMASGAVGFGKMRRHLGSGSPHLLLLGTAWGLAPEVIEAADLHLKPVTGPCEYNHLSVRAACAVILDRLLGDWRD